MPTYVALLRGINLGSRNRVAMADLRALLTGLGYQDVRTHLQSGNAVFRASTRSATPVAKAVEEAISTELGLQIRVLVRTPAQLAAVVAANPLGERAVDHSRYMVVFCERPVPSSPLDDLDRAAFEPEEFAVVGSEIYLWLPPGLRNSRLAGTFADRRLSMLTTTRNWRTVLALAKMSGA